MEGDGVDAIWQRAQMQSLASGHGPGDAMMTAIAEAADARWEQRRHSSGRNLFDL